MNRNVYMFLSELFSVRVGSLETKWSWQKILTFPKISKGQNGEYVCILGTTGENETVLVNVQGKWTASILYDTHLQHQRF